MTVYLPKGRVSYVYDFWYRRRRYFGNTGQVTPRDAQRFEDNERLRIRRVSAGLATDEDSPSFKDWADIFYAHVSGRIRRPEHVRSVLIVVLRFWGARPTEPGVLIDETAPYHDLTLADPILDPDWIERFEAWIRARPIGGQTRNHYRSVMSRMYRVSMLPAFRKDTGVTVNPFLTIERDTTTSRDVTITPDELRHVVSVAPYYIRLSIAIGALAPALRLQNILELRFDEHIDDRFRYITIRKHKTRKTLRRPLVQPISDQLRTILEDRRRRDDNPHVVTYRGQSVTQIRGGLRHAVERAGLPYGRDRGGVTFHTLRHVAQTEMADLGISEAKRADVMGHADTTTTRKYTHMRPRHLVEPIEQLSERLDLADAVLNSGVGTTAGTHRKTPSKTPMKPRTARTALRRL